LHLNLCMHRQIIVTADGSHTVSIPEMNLMYHSVYGAIQESQHVFIEAGFLHASERLQRPEALHILEIGFGTGLNALLTLIEAENKQLQVHYTALELYPLSTTEIAVLNYCEQLSQPDLQNTFNKLHTNEWEKDISMTRYFTLHKISQSLLQFSTNTLYDLVYFDAFAPAAQPELWTKEVFENVYRLLSPKGILVTYCSKGDVRRNMQAAGFIIEKIPGPKGKREMMRAIKEDDT